MFLKNKTALVTGGSKGIGYAVAEALLSEGAGVMICARKESELKSAVERLSKKGNVAGVICDVRDDAQVRETLDKCVASFGGVDILVNNAGIGYFGKTVEQISPDEFRQTLETNLYGVFYFCHHAIPLMKKRGGGYIINVSSLAGQNPHPKMAAYNASKFALNGFTEALMQEVRQDDIKVSYICPGSVNTEFGGDEAGPEKAWQLQPPDIADAILYLLRGDKRALPSKIEIRPSKPPLKS